VAERLKKYAVHLIILSQAEIYRSEIVSSIETVHSEIIQSVDRNRHEDAALQRAAGNARTISGQQAYHKRPVAINRSVVRHHNSMWVLTCSDPHEHQIVGTGTQKRDITRNMPGCVTYSSHL